MIFFKFLSHSVSHCNKSLSVLSKSELKAVVRVTVLWRKASCCRDGFVTVHPSLLSHHRPRIVAFTESSSVVFTHRRRSKVCRIQLSQRGFGACEQERSFRVFTRFSLAVTTVLFVFCQPPESCHTCLKGRSDSLSDGLHGRDQSESDC